MAKTSGNEVAKYQSLGKKTAEAAIKYNCQNSSKVQPNSQNIFEVSNEKH